MITLDLARAHIRDLHREAARHSLGVDMPRRTGRLRRLVNRMHAER
ncbi:MAG: hypothetical protein ABJA93_01455 [Sporichthyaceae bacterium]